ncbi:hypothetical protein [Aquabacterium sp.]|uniref:hypothetical protein n=1 Tax=Aquabacterium sp. TaxID=1872578 RepID=UPI002E369255|nr:hypothetical protein [Aquabacterium sp.]HEX5311996.1 hypothetical protein [Aquabacterium sp.]
MKHAAFFLICLTTGVAVSGCSTEQLYAAGRNAQRAECMRQPDSLQREQCLKDAGMSHDAYQREKGAAGN